MNADDVEKSRTDDLLEEFIRDHLAGEVPDPVAFVSRAGPDAPRLRELIALFLAESDPVEPNPETAARLSARYGGDLATARADPAYEEPGFFAQVMTQLLANWHAATVERRTKLLDRIADGAYTLILAPETMRGVEDESAGGPTTIPLHHPSGASAQVREDDQLWLTVFGMPSELVGSCPLVAFPWVPTDSAGLVWSGHDRGLPDGLVEADEIGERRVLFVQVGKLGERRQLDQLLREIRVVAIPPAKTTG